MSDNPFINPPNEPAPPVDSSYQPPGPTKRAKPSWLTFIFVVTLILGLMGILGSCFVIGGPFISKAVNNLMGDQGQTDEQIAARDQIQAMGEEQYIPNLLFGLLNLVLASMLIVGAIGGLSRKPWTPKILKMGYTAAIVFLILRIIYSLYIQITTMDQMLKLSMQQAGPAGESMSGFIRGMFWFGIVFGIFITFAFLIFYALSLMKMKSPDVEAYFESQ